MSESTTRRASRSKIEYEIEVGMIRPPRVRDSIYPWDEMREAAVAQILAKSVELVSFFVSCDDEEHASASRISIQISGRTYYQKRRQNSTVGSALIQEDDVWGVRSWVTAFVPAEDVEEEEDSTEG